MNNESDTIDNLFLKHENNWDINELKSNHQDLFLQKLKDKKSKRNYFVPFAVAASLLLIVGLTFLFKSNEKPKDLQFASAETRQTDSIFTVLIEKELIKVKEKNSPENEVIIKDALTQMKILDVDYQNIILELKKDGENKSIIMALIANLQTRISFLQNVLQQIESNEKIKIISDETT